MCNAWNHSRSCGCGFGGDTSDHQSPLPERTWRHADEICWLTKCPICGQNVFFVRHNGGSVWFDDLGYPWPKHGCFEDGPTEVALRRELNAAFPKGMRGVLGVVIAADRPKRRGKEHIVIHCHDKSFVDYYAPAGEGLPLGQLVVVSRTATRPSVVPVVVD